MEQPNNQHGKREFDPLTKILIWIAGAPEQVLRQSPARDLTPIRATAWLMIATLFYQAALFTLIGEELFDPYREIVPVVVLAALALATFIGLIDRYAVVISGFHHEGLTELARGGIEIRGGAFNRFKLAFFLIARIGVLSVGLAMLCGLFVSLLIFSGDIHSQLEHEFQQDNAALITEQTTIVDAQIKRTEDAVKGQTAQVEALARQVGAIRQIAIDPMAGNAAIQQAEQELQSLLDQRAKIEQEIQADQTFAANEIGGIKGAGNSGRPGYGLRYRAAMQKVTDAKAHLQSIDQQLSNARARLDSLRAAASSNNDAAMQHATEQLPSFEASLKAETDKLTGLKDELAKLIAGRDAEIRKAVENAPNYIGYDNGLVSQIRVLEALSGKDRKIAVLIVLVDVVSFGLELAAVLSRVTGYAPTTFAALLARDVYMGAVRIVEEMMEELEKRQGEEPDAPESMPSKMPPDNNEGGSGAAMAVPPKSAEDPGSQPSKRKRGRPRKHPLLTVITGGNGQEPSGQRPEPPRPA